MLKELRGADPTLPVVMVTVNTEVAVVQECLREGGIRVCAKAV